MLKKKSIMVRFLTNSRNKTLNIGLHSTKSSDDEMQKVIEYIDKYVKFYLIFLFMLTLQNNWKLLAVEFAASNLKSTALSIALMNDRIKVEEALDLSRLEENYQITLYGEVLFIS